MNLYRKYAGSAGTGHRKRVRDAWEILEKCVIRSIFQIYKNCEGRVMRRVWKNVKDERSVENVRNICRMWNCGKCRRNGADVEKM